MKSLFEAASAKEIKTRIERLTADSERLWGTMNAGQMLAHCSAWMEMAAGVNTPPRSMLGRVFGKLAKRELLADKPARRNMPTDKILLIVDEKDFAAERQRLLDWIERFAAGGPEQCTKHPHSFLGHMTPEEWARLGYKHLDHHLKQFGA